MKKERQPTTWAPVIRQLLRRAEVEAERWSAAYRTRRAGGDMDGAPAIQAILQRSRVARAAVDEISLALTLENAGRDVAKLRSEILSCFTKTGEHRPETITKRLFCEEYPSWDQRHFVEQRLEHLEKKGLLYKRFAERGGGYLYMLRTPERVAERQRIAVEHAKSKAERDLRRARLDAVVAMLRELGCASASHDGYTKITVDVDEAEKLVKLDFVKSSKVA